MSNQQFVSAALSVILLLSPWPAAAQESRPAQLAPAAGQGSAELKVLVLEGARAINNTRTRQVTAPVVEVRNADNVPVAGAEVTFELPATGPGGVFEGGARTQTTRTNHQGQATVSGYTPNEVAGRFSIQVRAVHGAAAGSATIDQMNSTERFLRTEEPKRSGGSKKRWILIGAAAAAGAATVFLLTRDSGSKDVVLIPGGVTIGGPR